MSEGCTHNCETCGEHCSSRKPESLLAPLNEGSKVKKVIAVVSGKGGVGKSLVTALLSVMAQRDGLKTAIMDADITGPSIPKAFGLGKEHAEGCEQGIKPVMTHTGIATMSLNLLVDNETDPVIWRGPVLAGTVKQFWTEVYWGDQDIMFIDMPPGTGDVPLTVFQSLPINGIVIVASPQELVGMIVEKAVRMADMMHIPVLALVENMSYFKCPDCGKEHHIYGESHLDEIAARYGIDTLAQLPIDPTLAAGVDAGQIELFSGDWLNDVFEKIKKI